MIDFDELEELEQRAEATAAAEAPGAAAEARQPADPAEWQARLQAALAADPAPTSLKAAAPWLSSVGKAPATARVRLVAFNWTGNRGGAGSAHNFMKWPAWLAEGCAPGTWEVCQVNYPGRGARMKEPNVLDAQAMAASVSEALGKAGKMPTVFFGFSFGAVLAYEVAALCAARGEPPLGLVVASAEHPAWPGRSTGAGPNGGATKDLDDAAFERVLREKGGTDVILSNPDMKRMYVPVIRADMVMEEAYGAAPPQHEPLGCPVLAFRGESCPQVSREDTDAWLWLTDCWGEGLPTWVEELSSGLSPTDSAPWLSDWYLCQGEGSAKAMAHRVAEVFGGKG